MKKGLNESLKTKDKSNKKKKEKQRVIKHRVSTLGVDGQVELTDQKKSGSIIDLSNARGKECLLELTVANREKCVIRCVKKAYHKRMKDRVLPWLNLLS